MITMVKKLQLFLVLLIMLLVFGDCGQNKVNQTNESTTVYIGDNSKVAAIANRLPILNVSHITQLKSSLRKNPVS